jgi:hypothetical protein
MVAADRCMDLENDLVLPEKAHAAGAAKAKESAAKDVFML